MDRVSTVSLGAVLIGFAEKGLRGRRIPQALDRSIGYESKMYSGPGVLTFLPFSINRISFPLIDFTAHYWFAPGGGDLGSPTV